MVLYIHSYIYTYIPYVIEDYFMHSDLVDVLLRIKNNY